MKNIRRLLIPTLLAAFFFTACKNKCDNDDFGIESLQPAANPTGYEVFIKANGVTADTKVYFDAVESPSVKTAEGGLIVEVPANIAGTVSLSIEAGKCSDSRSFEVLGSYPGNVPAGPTTIIIPQLPGSLPTGISNAWKNAFDENHFVGLFDLDNGGDGIFDDDPSSEEQHFGTLDFLNDNPVSGHYDIQDNEIFVVIDRSSKPGGFRDTLTGGFIKKIPEAPSEAVTMVLLTSSRTGRQLILYRDF